MNNEHCNINKKVESNSDLLVFLCINLAIKQINNIEYYNMRFCCCIKTIIFICYRGIILGEEWTNGIHSTIFSYTYIAI